MANVTFDVKTEAPAWWKRISRSLRFILASLIVTFSTTDMYSPDASKHIVFWLGIGVIVVTGLDIAIGTKQLEEEDTINLPKAS